MNKHRGTLYLIPTPLSSENNDKWLTDYHKEIINSLNDFIIEELRTARRFLKACGYEGTFDNTNFYTLNEHSTPEQMEECFKPLIEGRDTGIISEAGMPCIADPGSFIVQMAHLQNIKIIPLPGSSSIFMALAASGLNGQSFVFHGYIPIDKHNRKLYIREMEADVSRTGKSNIFIETPYRNQSLKESLLESCRPGTMLCIASDIGGSNEFIKCMSISSWHRAGIKLGKTPAVFILGRNLY